MMATVLTSIIILVTLIAGFFAANIPKPQAINGLNGEAGVILPNGEVIILETKPNPLAIYKVNSVSDLPEDTLIFWRFWLNLKATGFSGTVTGVRFSLTQKINGVLEPWCAGTENWGDRPQTFKNEAWFLVNLPKDIVITVPIKYRDNFCGGEPPLLPYTEYSADKTHVIRDRRMDVVKHFVLLVGQTVTWEIFCEVHEITWQWVEVGVTKTGSITSSPSIVSYIFTITKTAEAGITATLSSGASH